MLVISKSGINRHHDSSRHSEVSVESHSCLTAASGPFSPPLVTSSQQHGVCWHRAGAGAVLSREDNSRKERMNLTALTPCPSEVHGDVLLNVRSSPVLMGTYSSIDRTRRGLLQPARKHCFMGQTSGMILHLLVLCLLGDTALTPPAGRGPRGDSSRWLRAGAGTGSPGPVSPVGKEGKGRESERQPQQRAASGLRQPHRHSPASPPPSPRQAGT